MTRAASTECLLPLPATKEWGEGLQPVQGTPLPGPTAVELSQLRRTWSAEFIPLPADLHVPRGGGLKSALLNSTALGAGGGFRGTMRAQHSGKSLPAEQAQQGEGCLGV